MGPSGTGKTFLAAGLVFDAVKAGYKAYLMTMEDIVNCLRLKDISTPAMMTYNKILRAQLLAIDDIMLFPVKREEATAFFNLINTLHEKTSIIITTNKAPTEWVETLNDEILASALLDRLLYRCEVIKFTGSSYRLENRQTIFKTTGTRNELISHFPYGRRPRGRFLPPGPPRSTAGARNAAVSYSPVLRPYRTLSGNRLKAIRTFPAGLLWHGIWR